MEPGCRGFASFWLHSSFRRRCTVIPAGVLTSTLPTTRTPRSFVWPFLSFFAGAVCVSALNVAIFIENSHLLGHIVCNGGFSSYCLFPFFYTHIAKLTYLVGLIHFSRRSGRRNAVFFLRLIYIMEEVEIKVKKRGHVKTKLL